jgi:hypothetical protein
MLGSRPQLTAEEGVRQDLPEMLARSECSGTAHAQAAERAEQADNV